METESMLAIFNDVVPAEYPPAVQAQRRAIEQLTRSLPASIKTVITSSFGEVHDLVTQTPEPFLLYTNFPPNRVHVGYDRTGLFLLSSRRSGHESRDKWDTYSISLEILRRLASAPNARLICVVTGAPADVVSDDDIRSCGPPGIVRVHRKQSLLGFNNSEPFPCLAKHFLSCILEACRGTAEVESASKDRGSSGQRERTPLFLYDAGMQIHAPELNRTMIDTADGEQVSIMVPSVPDTHVFELEKRFFELRAVNHPASHGVGFLVPRRQCSYCAVEMQGVLNVFFTSGGSSSNASGAFCSSCGWWVFRAEQRMHLDYSQQCHVMHRQLRVGQMRHFEPSDLNAPVHAVSEALASEPDLLRQVKPRRFEEIVHYAFSSFFDCEVELTKTTRDGGADIVGFDSNRGKFLIEVKQRTKPEGRVGVNVVRALCGALIQNRANSGLVVTNAVYTRDAKQVANEITEHGWPIELHDIQDVCEWLDLVAKRGEDRRRTSRMWLERLVTGFQAIHGDFSDDYDPSIPRIQECTIRF
jgi:restriction system protein